MEGTKTPETPPDKALPSNWFQRMVYALLFTVVVYVGSVTGGLLFDHLPLAAALRRDLRPVPLAIWFGMGLLVSLFVRFRARGSSGRR